MSWTSLVATYAIVWWLVLFTTLPFGIRTPDTAEEGMEPGAPEKPRMWIKVAVTTVATTLITGVVWALFEFDFVDFRATTD